MDLLILRHASSRAEFSLSVVEECADKQEDTNQAIFRHLSDSGARN
jgi:hypothetical protein